MDIPLENVDFLFVWDAQTGIITYSLKYSFSYEIMPCCKFSLNGTAT